jgi:hypothetical protein
MSKSFAAAASLAALAPLCALAQGPAGSEQPTANAACHGSAVSGTVRDSTQALIPGATLRLDGRRQVSGADGHFDFPCIKDGAHKLNVTAQGFAARDLPLTTPHSAALDVTLKLESVQSEVSVDAGNATIPSATSAGPSQSLSGTQLQSLADDPDDLLRELQQLSAAGGGSPGNATISVDGFQGTSTLPPKSSIAYINVNPDLFSAQYREPPFDGGRIEIFTKPGQKAYHGALFLTNGSPWENARDPFSTAKAALGKQRYGFELNGPVRKQGSDFALTLEHRSIDNFAVVNAFTFDANGNQVATIANVATPQRLWVGTSRLDWQLGAKNTATISYSANVNHLANVGVGGTSLAQTGYDSQKWEHAIRMSGITLVSAHLMHEARVSLTWTGFNDTPVSTAPQLQVAGAFTSGGATLGATQVHKFDIEYDDDAVLTTRNHILKFGGQFFVFNEHQRLLSNFNGTYVFGGGTAPVLDASNNPIPGQTTTITGVQQYQRAVRGLAGGTATAFTNVAGTPAVAFVQTQDALFLQDDWNVGRGVHIAGGIRWAAQNQPALVNGIVPRLGILWSPTKQGTWTLHAHIGMFTTRDGDNEAAEVLREDGVARVTSTAYNSAYCAPTASACSPFSGTTPIHTYRTYAPGNGNGWYAIENIGGTRTLPHGWNLSLDYYFGRLWDLPRSNNINAPLNGQPTGPRPGPANTDILQVQNSSQGKATVLFAGVENHTYKRGQFFFGAARVNLIDDNDDGEFFTPQNAYSNAGEFAHRSGQPVWNVFGNGTLNLPEKLALSLDMNAAGDAHYNITTGFDNNGDGNFNDRPRYALPGTPGAIQTQYGLLVASGGTGVFPRDKGQMPWTFYLDTNLQRAFKMTHNAKAEHQRTLTLNVRSSNVLNHLNVTSVGGVLGSPLFGVPYTADNGRRVEAGARYSF